MVEPSHPRPYAGVGSGPLHPGERVTLSDAKGRRHSILLAEGGVFHTAKGAIAHDDLIGGPEGVVVHSVGGTAYLALRPLLAEWTVTMPRGAAVVYPKDAAQILGGADIFPGARVIEAGVGSGALTLSLLRAVGPTGRLLSYERRSDFAAIARKNVESFLGAAALDRYQIHIGDSYQGIDPAHGPFDRVVLDLPEPWQVVPHAESVLSAGGLLVAYTPSITQAAQVREALKGKWIDGRTIEVLHRGWHIDGQAVRPDHRMVAHTGFLSVARFLGRNES